MKKVQRTIFNCLLVLSHTSVWGQVKECIPPMNIPLLLSGSFGELRATHFHSGVDFRTGGVEGIPVLSVNDGVVSRIFVSDVGYGKAVYIDHPDGTTTVYAHLQRFNERLEQLVRETQYGQEHFCLNEYISDRHITFKRGEVIGYSGNTGSSGGPHLHFEYRETKTERLLNPLSYISVKDDIAPVPRGVYLYLVSEEGTVIRKEKIFLKKNGENSYTAPRHTVSSGKVGLGFHITDAMNGSWNKLGIYKLELYVDSIRYFSIVKDSNTFESYRLVNEIKDFQLYEQEKETVYCTFGFYMDRILGAQVEKNGCFEVKKGKETNVHVAIADYNGNTSFVDLKLYGGEFRKKEEEDILRYDKDYLLEADEYSLLLGTGVLFNSCLRMVTMDSLLSADGLTHRVFRTAKERIPLLQSVKLHVKGTFHEKEVICLLTEKGELSVQQTYRDQAGIYAMVKCLGSYTTIIDTLPPQIIALGESRGNLRFKITDALSGIDVYRGEVNEKWCLFEYDAKNNLLFCNLKEPFFGERGTNRIVLTVTDKAGNVAKYEETR